MKSGMVQVAALQTAAAEQAALAAADLARHVAASEAALAGAKTDAAAAVAQAQQDSTAAAACAAAEAAVREEGLRAQVGEAVAWAAGPPAAREEAVRLELCDGLAVTGAQAAGVAARLQAAAASPASAAQGTEERADAAAVDVKRLSALLQESAAEVAALRAVVLAQCLEREGWRSAQGCPDSGGAHGLGYSTSASDDCKHGEQQLTGQPGAGARWALAKPVRAVRLRLGRHFVA